MAIKNSGRNSAKLIPKIDRELRAVRRDIDVTVPKIEDRENKVLSYKMLVLGVIIGIFGNVIASALWEPKINEWQFIVVIASVVILIATIVFVYERLRKYER